MKCIAVAVVLVALAVSAVQSGIVLGAGGLVLPPLSYTAQTVDLNGLQATVVAGQPHRLVSAGVPILAGSVLGGTVVTADGTVQVAGAPAVVQLAGLPAGIQLVQAPAPAAIQLVQSPAVVQAVVQAEGNYVAATRGAVHTAPLPGHSQSASSINLEPAPGTL